MMILKEFSRIVCVSLFSYQGSLFVISQTARLLYHIHSVLVKNFFKFFRSIFFMIVSPVQATCLLYHIFITGLSTTFLFFSKLFKLCVQKNQFFVTAQLEYHFLRRLSTVF